MSHKNNKVAAFAAYFTLKALGSNLFGLNTSFKIRIVYENTIIVSPSSFSETVYVILPRCFYDNNANGLDDDDENDLDNDLSYINRLNFKESGFKCVKALMFDTGFHEDLYEAGENLVLPDFFKTSGKMDIVKFNKIYYDHSVTNESGKDTELVVGIGNVEENTVVTSFFKDFQNPEELGIKYHKFIEEYLTFNDTITYNVVYKFLDENVTYKLDNVDKVQPIGYQKELVELKKLFEEHQIVVLAGKRTKKSKFALNFSKTFNRAITPDKLDNLKVLLNQWKLETLIVFDDYDKIKDYKFIKSRLLFNKPHFKLLIVTNDENFGIMANKIILN